MKKEILTHFGSLIVFFSFAVLFKNMFGLDLKAVTNIGLFLGGGILGTILPDLDHVIYVYLLHPQEATSQRIGYTLQNINLPPITRIKQAFELMASTRSERTRLIFHTTHFQLIFWILAFLVISSSGSIFGRGLVLAFSLHLIVDQFLDLEQLDNLNNWFRLLGVELEKEKYVFYWLGNLVALLIFGFVL